jgi:hypothetical protein
MTRTEKTPSGGGRLRVSEAFSSSGEYLIDITAELVRQPPIDVAMYPIIAVHWFGLVAQAAP